jgi:hypothetical protein
MLQFFSTLLSLIFIFIILNSFGYTLLKILRANNYFYLTPIFGYSIIIILINYCYFAFNLTSIKISYTIFVLFLFIFLINLFLFRITFIKNTINNVFLVLPLLIIFLLIAKFLGEQYYVFRGNAWDYFGYITSANLSSDYNYIKIKELLNINDLQTQNMYFDRSLKWFVTFPVFSSVFGIFINSLNFNIFFEFYLFKVIIFCLYFLSIYALFKILFKFSFVKSFFISFVLVFSFYSYFIYEIDSLRQLSTLNIFISFLILFQKVIKKNTFDYKEISLIYILLSVLYLMYNELLFFVLFIVFISLFFDKNFKKLLNLSNIKILFLGLFIFLLSAGPSFLIMYEVLISQFSLGISLKPIWYVYFGSFIFGRISPDLFNQEFINHMAAQLHSDINIIEFFSIIITSFDKFELTYVFFNIIPSFFGFYYLTDIPISENFDFVYKISLALFGIFLIYIYFKNLKFLFKTKRSNLLIFKSLNICFFLIFFIFFFQAKIFAIIKLILYFFIIFFIPIFINLKNNKIRIYLCILALIFPIYKFSNFNNGITRADSFPSIQLIETKKNYNWVYNHKQYTECDKINLNIKDEITNNKYHTPENVLNYFKYHYLVLNLLNNNFDFKDSDTLINFDKKKSINLCEINEEKIN